MSAIGKKKKHRNQRVRSISRTIYPSDTNPTLRSILTNTDFMDQLEKYPEMIEQQTIAAAHFFSDFKNTVGATLFALGLGAPLEIRILKPSNLTPIGRHSVGVLWDNEACASASHEVQRFLLLRYEPSRVIVQMMEWPEKQHVVSVDFEVGES